jgi:hypothetical protein
MTGHLPDIYNTAGCSRFYGCFNVFNTDMHIHQVCVNSVYRQYSVILLTKILYFPHEKQTFK